MMLSDLAEYCMNESGRLIMAQGVLSNLGITYPQLWSVIRHEILDYQRYVPITKRFNIYSFDGPPYVYDFTLDQNNIGFVNANNCGVTPKKISKVVPTGQQQTLANWLSYRTAGGVMGGIASPSRVPTPRMFVPRYLRPKLYFTEYGQFDVMAHYEFLFNYVGPALTPVNITQTFPTGNNLITAQITEVTSAAPVAPGSVSVLFNDSVVATDNADGGLEFTSSYSNFSGNVSYVSGTVSIRSIDLPSAMTDVSVQIKSNSFTDVEIVGLQQGYNAPQTKLLLDFCTAKFMLQIARIFRAVNQTDLAILSDAAQLADEGQKLYDDAKTRMIDRVPYWKAIRP